MRYTKKGQSSFEYLLTYGWAFLIIFAVAGAFIYMNVSDTRSIISQRCIASDEIICEEFALFIDEDNFSNSELVLIFRNAKDSSIMFQDTMSARGNFLLGGRDFNVAAKEISGDRDGVGVLVPVGLDHRLRYSLGTSSSPGTGTLTFTDPIPVGELVALQLEIPFNQTGRDFQRAVLVDIVVIAQEMR
ncbi:MAG: hypothetical protein ACMXYK_01100 [Candidatus Woesearchaeota archaeon]